MTYINNIIAYDYKLYINEEIYILSYIMDFKIAYKRLQEINLIIKSEPVIDIQELIALQMEAEQLFNYLQIQLKKQNNE